MQSEEQDYDWLSSAGGSANLDEAPQEKLRRSMRPYESHPLVKDKYYYTLPVELLTTIIAEVGHGRFDSDLVEMELTMSRPCGDHSRYAGYWRAAYLPYRGLRIKYTKLPSDKDKQSLWPYLQEPLKSQRIYVLDWDYPTLRRDFRSYAGWLLTNNQFLDEHDSLLSQHVDAICRWGTEQDHMPLSDVIHFDESRNPQNDPVWVAYASNRDEFLVRWRLGGLAGPYLPEPLEPHMDGWVRGEFLRRFGGAGGTFFLPDTIPLPSRDELRDSIEESRSRRKEAEHLSEWFMFIRPDNPARNQLERFSRIFELQHYWRVFHSRHSRTLKNAIGKLEVALANWFKVSQESIHQDLIRIRRRLGKEWLDRPFPV